MAIPLKDTSMAWRCVREILATASALREARKRTRALQRQLTQQLATYRALTDDSQPWEPR